MIWPERARLTAIDALSEKELDAAVAANDSAQAQVKAAEAAVKTAELNLGYTEVRSPIDGVMSRALIRIGGVVTAYTTLLTTVYQTDPMYANFSVGEQRLLQVQRELGRPLDQHNPSQRQFRLLLADGSEYELPGTMNFVDAAVDLGTDTLALRLTVPNPKQFLHAGQYVRVVVATRERPNALLLPQRAVQLLQDKNYVWIVDSAGTAQQRDVKMGQQQGSDWVVEEGLAPGDVVVIDGTQKLKSGTPVRIQPARRARRGAARFVSNFFIDRPIFATVLAIVITLAGLIAFLLLPVARFPQITPPSVVVSATFPGADASTIEQSVAAPIETQVNGVPNMIYMDSRSSNDGSYTLNVTFEVGTAQDIAAVDVQNQVAIAQRQLPPDVLRQGVSITKRQPQPLIFVAIEASDPRYDYLFLSNFATLQVFDSLARVQGVGQVLQFGARDYGMRIWLDPGKMSRLGVTTADISSAINEQNVVAPAGIVGAEPAPPGQQMTYTVTVHGRLRSVQEFENVVLKAGPNGSIVRLRDVARIELAATDYTRSSRLNGKPVALLGVYQLPDANALEVSKKVRATLEQLAEHFPRGIRYTIPLDTSEFVRESIREVEITLFIAMALVLLVVFLFLESWRATLIPMLAVPVSLLGTFTVFVALGFSINTLTLFALVLAIGLVVDDAIVVVEAVTEKMEEKGLDPLTATRAAMADVSSPVIAIALVLTAVFVPVAFLGGLTGQFYKQFALTLSVSVLISALIALTFTPALCALLLKPRAETEPAGLLGRGFAAFNRLFDEATKRYTGTVRHAIRRAGVALGVFGAIVVALALPDVAAARRVSARG